MGKVRLTTDGAQRLTFQIVNRACDDYVLCKKIINKGGKYITIEGHIRDVHSELNKVVRFFKSEWYTQLMPNIDPDKLIERLDFLALPREENEEEPDGTETHVDLEKESEVIANVCE